MTKYRNAEHAFLGELALLKADGSRVRVRNSTTDELIGRFFEIERPRERCVTIPHRHNNIAAAIVESMWVLAGRRDIAALLPYIPRAADFSDDGHTWRAGYGPRMRNWQSIDQLDAVRKLLLDDPTSRRAVVSLFDPAVDHTTGLDIPCNNWLHFIRRGDVLDLSIAVRSNDIVWGFSGINTFEWSVLHELMATWTGADVGSQRWFVSSMHIYERHFERSNKILDESRRVGIRAYPALTAHYAGEFDSLDDDVSQWFALEALIRTNESPGSALTSQIEDPLFRAFLQVITAYWAIQRGDLDEARTAVDAIGHTDLAGAITEYAVRSGVDLGIPSSDRETAHDDPAQHSGLPSTTAIRDSLKRLHAEKSAAYGDSWKRRGELLGVLANVARKVDRLNNQAAWSNSDRETRIDTLSDLLIYLVKYQTFLADNDADVAEELFHGNITAPASDGTAGLNHLLDAIQPVAPTPTDAVAQVSKDLEQLLTLAQEQPEARSVRSAIVGRMSSQTFALLLTEEYS